MNKAAEHQIDPEKNDLPVIQDLVIADIQARKEVGKERYGTYLQPFNGRSALMDAYQEALDLCQYLRQLLYEEEHKFKPNDRLSPAGEIGVGNVLEAVKQAVEAHKNETPTH